MTNVQQPMNVNPDPRPGRWMLPLVVLGMVAFTWVFVDQLPGEGSEAATTTADTSVSGAVDTTVPDGTQNNPDDEPASDETADTVASGGAATPEIQNYLEAMGVLGAQLTGFQTEMATVNTGWDARDINLEETTGRLTALRDDVATWQQQVADVEVPPDLSSAHQNMQVAAQAAAAEAANALDGLINSSGSEARLSAVERFDAAVNAFQEALRAAGG